MVVYVLETLDSTLEYCILTISCSYLTLPRTCV